MPDANVFSEKINQRFRKRSDPFGLLPERPSGRFAYTVASPDSVASPTPANQSTLSVLVIDFCSLTHRKED
jgi:hypothetical protein